MPFFQTDSRKRQRLVGGLRVPHIACAALASVVLLLLACSSLYACVLAFKGPEALACEKKHHLTLLVAIQFLVQFVYFWILPLFLLQWCRSDNTGSTAALDRGTSVFTRAVVAFFLLYTVASLAHGVTVYGSLGGEAEFRRHQCDARCTAPIATAANAGKARHFFATPPLPNCSTTVQLQRRATCLDLYFTTTTCGSAPGINVTGAWISLAPDGSDVFPDAIVQCDPGTRVFFTLAGVYSVWLSTQAAVCICCILASITLRVASSICNCRQMPKYCSSRGNDNNGEAGGWDGGDSGDETWLSNSLQMQPVSPLTQRRPALVGTF